MWAQLITDLDHDSTESQFSVNLLYGISVDIREAYKKRLKAWICHFCWSDEIVSKSLLDREDLTRYVDPDLFDLGPLTHYFLRDDE